MSHLKAKVKRAVFQDFYLQRRRIESFRISCFKVFIILTNNILISISYNSFLKTEAEIKPPAVALK